MDSDKQKAKELFLRYGCRHFPMDHDGIIDEYRKFGATESEEQAWRKEYITLWASRLSADDLTALNMLVRAAAFEALGDLIEIAGKGDAYVRLSYADAIWDLAGPSMVDPSLQKQARLAAMGLWRSLLIRPIHLPDQHRAESTPDILGFAGAATPEDYITDRAHRALAAAADV